MKVGYARTSTTNQEAGLEAQLRDLKAAGCEKIFCEQASSVGNNRSQLAATLEFVREGDSLVITRLDRLARSTAHLVEITSLLERKKVNFQIIGLGIDTGTASGKLVLSIFGAIAEFERSLMLERQREGIAKAKAEGKYKGRKPTVRERAGEIRALNAEGFGPTEIAKRLGIGRASVYRILAAESSIADE